MTRRCVTDEQYGNLWRRITEFVRRVDEGTVPYKSVMEGLQTLIERTAKLVYDIVVDYNRSLAEMIKAGKYDWVDDNINAKHFPSKDKGKHKLTTTLFYFNTRIESDDVIAEMDKQGHRPATIEELLALCEKYSDIREWPIVALGSVWRDPYGMHNVPCLEQNDSGGNFFYLARFDGRWRASRRFLALRK